MEIRRLDKFSKQELLSVMDGFVSDEAYLAEKTETDQETKITLRLVKLPKPNIKKYELAEESIYERVVPTGFSFGVFEIGEIAAIAIAEKLDWNKSLWVWEFHVKEAQRGKGIGKMLMERLFDEAKKAGLRTVVCETQNTNVPAIRFYRKLGFSMEGVDLSLYADFCAKAEFAVFMKKKP